MDAGTKDDSGSTEPITHHVDENVEPTIPLEDHFEQQQIVTEVPWEEVRNKNLEDAREKVKSKAAKRQCLLDLLLTADGKAQDIGALCGKYSIPVRVHGEHGDVYEKTDEELRGDIEAKLETERDNAWCATHQAAKKLDEPFVRTLFSAEGISTNSKFISLSNEDLVPISQGWGPSLCGMFAGRFPGKAAVIAMINRWKVPAKVAFHRKGWMIFSFRYAKDMEKVLCLGPQAIFGIPLILEPATEDFDFNKKLKVDIPVWIRIPDLPLKLWSRTAIEKIATSAGTPVMVDEDTILKYTLDGPRVQIIVNILEETRKGVEIVLPDGSKFEQEIVYEHLPKHCRTCCAFGHSGDGCPGPEEREKERIRRAKMNRPTTIVTRPRDPSRGPQPRKERGRNHSQIVTQGGYEGVNPNAGTWEPAGKFKGRGYPHQTPSNTIETSNKFDGLENEEPADTCTGQESNAEQSNEAADVHVNAVSFPVEIRGEAHRNAIKIATMAEGSRDQTKINVPPPLITYDIRVENPEYEDLEMEAPPLTEVVPVAQNIDPAAFPPLHEANSGHKGRKGGGNGVLGAAAVGTGRPPKGVEARRSKSKDPARAARRGRSKNRDKNGEHVRDVTRSRSRGPEAADSLSNSSDVDMMNPTQNVAAANRRPDVSRTQGRTSQ